MQKQISEFPTVNVPLPTDLLLISHSGMTANMSLNTVALYTNSLISGSINSINSNISRLSALEHLDTVTIGSNVLTLSADINSLKDESTLINANILRLSSLEHLDIVSLNSNVLNVSSNIDLLNTDYILFKNNSSGDIITLQDQVTAVKETLLYNNTYLDALSADSETLHLGSKEFASDINSLSGFYHTLSASVDLLITSTTELSANVSSLSASYLLNSSDILTLSADNASLSAGYLLNSIDILSLSADNLSLSASYWINSGDILTLSADNASLSADYLANSSDILTLSADITSLSAGYLLNTGDILFLSSGYLRLESGTSFLSAWVDSLDFTSPTNPTIQLLQTQIDAVSSTHDSVILNLSSWNDALSSMGYSQSLDISSLSASYLLNTSDILTLSADYASLSASYLLNSGDILTLSSSYLKLESGTSLLSAWVDSLDFTSPTNPTIQWLQTQIDAVSSTSSSMYFDITSLSASYLLNTSDILSLSANVSSLSASYLLNTSDILTLSADNVSLSANYLLNTSDILTLSADNVSLSASYLLNSSDILTLSADYASLSASYLLNSSDILSLSENIISLSGNVLDLNSLSVTVDLLSATGILDSYIKFSPDEIHGRGTLTISPSSNLLIQTSDSINSKIWSFDNSGQLTLPGNLIFSVDPTDGGPYTSPVELDVTLSVQKLNSGIYNLPDGVEGQIMYFVPKSNSVGDTSTQVYISNARYWIIDGLGHKLAVTSSIYWVPWILHDHRLDPVYDIMPTITTAIFTDGAWNISTGGRD